MEARLKRLEDGKAFDWSTAEAMAFGSLLVNVGYFYKLNLFQRDTIFELAVKMLDGQHLVIDMPCLLIKLTIMFIFH